MKQAQITKIDDRTYRFTERFLGADVYCYLLIGDERAMLIDTAYGFTDIPSAIRRLTDKPFFVVNTHGHFDHMSGNDLYEETYLSEKDRDLFCQHSDVASLKKLLLPEVNFATKVLIAALTPKLKSIVLPKADLPKPLPEEGYFELGNRRVEIIPTPGHTAGQIALLDTSRQWLFSADAICHDGVLLMFPESPGVRTQLETVRRLKQMAAEGRFTQHFPGHQETPYTNEVLDRYEEACLHLLEEPLTEHEQKTHLYTGFGLTINFDPVKLKKERYI